ncbi:MAG: 50S ribosomal protein L15 [Kiritimatiellae bacterium]|nr:50S ribosomal protein L15 [Kiritimatiellia bacterium]
MDLSNLTNVPGARHRTKRVGRGCGSGMGKTSTRGHKGQNARKGHKQKLGFEGGQMPLVRRLPKRGFNNAQFRVASFGVNVATLEKLFEAGDEVTVQTLAAKGLHDPKRPKIKILATGDLTKKLTVKVPVSAAAKAKIEAAGGTVA